MNSKVKLLLVDDEQLVRDELGGILEDEGYDVITGSDGQEGMELFRSEQPDMVITDIRMPRRDGLWLAMTIKQEAPDVPITVVTGHGTEAMAIDALRAGVTDFLKKPVRMEDLSGALTRMEAALHLATDVHQQAGMPESVQVAERSWRYLLNNDMDVIPEFVDFLLKHSTKGLDSQSEMELNIALRELILNAMEHGNLGLSYEAKSQALEEGSLEQVLAQRAALPEYVERRVTVDATRRERELTICITDMGEGFDWHNLADPQDPKNLLSSHGRGVLLARMSVDDLSFNPKGNQVTIIKTI